MAKSKKKSKKDVKRRNTPVLYNRGQRINQWSEHRMKMAIEEFHKGAIGLRQLARAWNVPKSTLQRRVRGLVQGTDHASGRKCIFTAEEEQELGSLLRTLAQRGFPLTASKVKSLAFQYATKKGKAGFSTEKGKAGYYWFQNFITRQHLSLRKPEALSAGRAAGMNRAVISNWFDDLEKLLDELNIRDVPSHMWNCDETGLQEHFVQGRVTGEKGQPCYQLTANEKGETTTVLACFNATGQFCPPTIIFKAKRLNAKWVVGSPPDSTIKVSDNGWITKEIFFEWAKGFVLQLPRPDIRPHILLLDGHSSHVYNLEFIELMTANNVYPFMFPAHTTHCLQPADKSYFKSLKNNWTNAGIEAIRKTGGRGLGKPGFFSVFTPAWIKSCTVETAQAGFRATGIFPLNRNIIPDSVYAPSDTSERPQETTNGSTATVNLPADPTPQSGCLVSAVVDAGTSDNPPEAPVLGSVDTASTSSVPLLDSGTVTTNTTATVNPPEVFPSTRSQILVSSVTAGSSVPLLDSGTSNGTTATVNLPADPTPHSGCLVNAVVDAVTCEDQAVTFASLMPIPHRERPQGKSARKRPPSYNLASDEHHEFVKQKASAVNRAKPKGKSTESTGRPTGSSGVKPSSARTRRPTQKLPKESVSSKGKAKAKKFSSSDTTPCGSCGKRFCDDELGEKWIQCQVCCKWYHNACQGIDNEFEQGPFICIICDDSDSD